MTASEQKEMKQMFGLQKRSKFLMFASFDLINCLSFSLASAPIAKQSHDNSCAHSDTCPGGNNTT
jgi:hypothetical protein